MLRPPSVLGHPPGPVIFAVRYCIFDITFAIEIFAALLVVPSGEDEILFGSRHDTQIIGVKRSPQVSRTAAMY